VTYAGGIGSMEDLEQIRRIGNGKVDFTIGSALDLFGGRIPYEVIKEYQPESLSSSLNHQVIVHP
jgi:phosphoribosylformimino-5-aminoimidazole carboxamide ribotide isomerase